MFSIVEMEPTSRTAEPAPASTHYLWEVPGKPISVYLDFDVVDRLSQEVMRGFGAVPRRGVECGGVLLGSIEAGEKTIVRVIDFEPVACQHTRGPGYLLSDSEQDRFGATVEQWKQGAGKQFYVVGFYRSHMREGLGLNEEDLRLYSTWLPGPAEIALVVKPFATRPSIGAFFFREGGHVRSESSYQEFPFRRRELGGEPPVADAPEPGSAVVVAESPAPAQPAAAPPESIFKRGAGWILVPLSFIFLLLGVALGFFVAVSVRSQIPVFKIDPYALGLSATPSGDSLHVNWNRSGPAIENARRGILWIQDGQNQKTVNLDLVQLQNGSIIYRRATNEVSFRLEIFARERITISESIRVRLDLPAPAR